MIFVSSQTKYHEHPLGFLAKCGPLRFPQGFGSAARTICALAIKQRINIFSIIFFNLIERRRSLNYSEAIVPLKKSFLSFNLIEAGPIKKPPKTILSNRVRGIKDYLAMTRNSFKLVSCMNKKQRETVFKSLKEEKNFRDRWCFWSYCDIFNLHGILATYEYSSCLLDTCKLDNFLFFAFYRWFCLKCTYLYCFAGVIFTQKVNINDFCKQVQKVLSKTLLTIFFVGQV